MAAPGIELSDGGLVDLEGVVDFLWRRGEALARRFSEEYDAAVLAARDFPLLGAPLSRGERRIRIGSGPYRLIYTIREDGIVVIIAVAHTSRRPGYWRERL